MSLHIGVNSRSRVGIPSFPKDGDQDHGTVVKHKI